MSSRTKRFLRNFDLTLFITVILLSLYCILIISSAAKSTGLKSVSQYGSYRPCFKRKYEKRNS